MEIEYLIDTNIFLEILLEQDKKENCKKFLYANSGKLSMTDFTLHSIGVILFKHEKQQIFEEFIEDVIPNVRLLSLPINLYSEIISEDKQIHLDFDDAYQYTVARHHGLKIVTMDKDFAKTKDINIVFI